jgi:hypothetical protein
MRLAVLVAGAALIAACEREDSRAEIEAEDAKARGTSGGRARPANAGGGAAAGSATAWPGAPIDLPDGQGRLRLIAQLDDSVRRFPTDARVPGWLYAAGVEGVRHAHFYPETPVDSALFAALPHAFEFREIAGNRYTGWHLTQLVSRFPTDSLADDAAFLIAERADFEVWDCEGHLSCHLGAAVGPWTGFLSAHPKSPLVPTALAQVDTMLGYFFDRLEAGRMRFAPEDTTAEMMFEHNRAVGSIVYTLGEYERALDALPAPHGALAIEAYEPIKARWLRAKGSP